MSWYQWLKAILYIIGLEYSNSLVGLFVPFFPNCLPVNELGSHSAVRSPQECAKAVGEECGGPWEVNQSLDFHFPTIVYQYLDFHDHEPRCPMDIVPFPTIAFNWYSQFRLWDSVLVPSHASSLMGKS